MNQPSQPSYLEYLGIATPTIADYTNRKNVRPIQLFALAILEAGRPLRMEEVSSVLTSNGWVPATGDPLLSLQKAWAGRLPIVQRSDGCYDLDLNCIELRMRLHEIGIVVNSKHNPNMQTSIWRTNATDVPHLKRALIHAFQVDGAMVGVTLLDFDQRSLSTVFGEGLSAIPAKLTEYSVIVGIRPRDILLELGVSDMVAWRLIDLAHHPKSKQLNKRGRKLAITTELLITSSTGISKPLGDAKKMRTYWEQGNVGMLTKRMESDIKSLYAFYRYGALHNGIRLRWGFLDERFLAEWSIPSEPSLYEILRERLKSGEPIEFVRGSAPGWKDPWSRVKRAIVKQLNPYEVVVEIDGYPEVIPKEEIQAIR
jgi:hypothetical protein